MPHHINVRDIPMAQRRPRLTAYVAQIRSALLNPAIPDRQRKKLQNQLARILTELHQS